ncbi:hypothetical protein NMG60_11027993 [Bertholletia excelsa]
MERRIYGKVAHIRVFIIVSFMKLKRGSKVEVMSKNKELISWRCAEIISGNGHTYSVKYCCNSGSASESIEERVSRKAIRPCPPPVEGVKTFLVGDSVEVFDNGLWKIATLLKVLDRDHYLVRLVGLHHEMRVHKSEIRVQQSWQDNMWVVIGEGYQGCEFVKSNHEKTNIHLLQASRKMEVQEGHECVGIQENAGLPEPHKISSGSRKRASPFCSSLLDACTGQVQKMRAIEKEGRHQRLVPAPLREKGHCWRHACFASKGLKMMRGCCLSLDINNGALSASTSLQIAN